VMTEHHTFGREMAPKSVSLGSYGTDTHEIRRIVKDGVVAREGKTATGRGGAPPYPIGYDAIVPKASECENLLVTFALSASHTAFSSIRMEPVFMCTSQSAASAACLAIDDGVPVQRVGYNKLREQLISFGQILEWPKTAATRENSKPKGIVMDDKDGVYQGAWETSARIDPFIGTTYQHDNNRDQGQRSATFTPDLPEAGDYEVRLIYLATTNRATNATVTIHHAQGSDTVKVNQREDIMVNGVPHALGVFPFAKGKAGSVVVSNEEANGYVVVDGMQWLPVELAKKERDGSLDAGFASNKAFDPVAEKRRAQAAAVAFSPLTATQPGIAQPKPNTEPIALKTEAQASDVDGKGHDLVVVGGTAGGIATAVTAAREGLSVLLVQHNRHIGGMLANGLMQWDALYGGPRSPLFSELLRNIEQHYIETFGRDSKEHQVMRHTHEHYPIGWVEPQVMERECHRLLAGEKNVTLLLEHYPVAVKREGAKLVSVTLRRFGGEAEIQVSGTIFADATYEGDLLALADVPFRVGREAREEYGEPHAGKVFVNIASGPPQNLINEGLNIRPYSSHQGSMDPTSPFTADHHPQAYNLRPCVSCDPENRILLSEPPPGYDREEYVNYERKGIATNSGPNQKSHMNSPILPSENFGYPEGTWEEREAIFNRHKNFALGLIWFLQNDESVPESKRRGFREWGLAKDEFTDNNHLPYEMYVREARRLVGRHVMSELDGSVSPDYPRAPIQPDSIAITDWYMDSHACTMDSRPGFHYDGKLILTEESRPAQVPYRCLLPKGVDNLLVPVCLSSTHIAWGSLRLEPVWMQTGEAAGLAAALSAKHRVTPGTLDSKILVRELAARRHLISFFNEIKVDANDPRIPAAQYFATQGFFASYDARLNEPLSEPVKQLWTQAFRQLKEGSLDARQLAREIHAAEEKHPAPTKEQRGAFLLKLWNELPL
ncbi:MAG: FAD-dependent oxidoreductase, partial [Verrucomicrobiales bacterium]|nr:FAD-dependent oxidoreductase [Verrucomicrobiales bacterium]